MYRDPDDNGYLPQHLWLNCIATLINNNAKTRVRDIATPRARHTDGATFDWDTLDNNEQPYCHIQGFTPRVLRLDQDRNRVDNGCDRGGRRELDRWGSPGFRDHGFCDRDPGGPPGDCRGNAPQGRSIRPDQRRRPYMPNVIGAVCKRRGHPASSCDMLAISLFVERHKNQLLESEKLEIEENWIARWKDKVDQPARSTPRQVMRAYCDDLYISVNHLADAMDWDCWSKVADDNVADE